MNPLQWKVLDDNLLDEDGIHALAHGRAHYILKNFGKEEFAKIQKVALNCCRNKCTNKVYEYSFMVRCSCCRALKQAVPVPYFW